MFWHLSMHYCMCVGLVCAFRCVFRTRMYNNNKMKKVNFWSLNFPLLLLFSKGSVWLNWHLQGIKRLIQIFLKSVLTHYLHYMYMPVEGYLLVVACRFVALLRTLNLHATARSKLLYPLKTKWVIDLLKIPKPNYKAKASKQQRWSPGLTSQSPGPCCARLTQITVIQMVTQAIELNGLRH